LPAACADHNQSDPFYQQKTESSHGIQIGSFRPNIIHHRMIINYGIELEKLSGERKRRVVDSKREIDWN
jgi:hypothetical protein